MTSQKEDLKVISSLSPVEREILYYLNLGSASEIAEKAKLDETRIKRALQFLSKTSAGRMFRILPTLISTHSRKFSISLRPTSSLREEKR